MAFNKKLAMSVGGLAAGGVGAVVIDGMIQNTDYAKSDPQGAFYAKAGGGAAAIVAGALLWKKSPLVGALLAVGGGVIAGKGYFDWQSYREATAPPSVTIAPGSAGGQPVTLSAPSGGLPATGGVPVLLAGPAGMTAGLSSPGVSAMPRPMLFAGPQSGAAVRLGMGRQSGAAVRLGMGQSGAAVRLGIR